MRKGRKSSEWAGRTYHVQQSLATGERVESGAEVEIGPCGRFKEEGALTPADRDMGIVAIGALDIADRELPAPVDHLGGDRHDDLGVDAIGPDQDLDTVPGFLPVRIARDRRADPCCKEKEGGKADQDDAQRR